MEYEDENDRSAGTVPECGAIFMANTASKKECFKRKILALPSARADFVLQVKTGMILFLFEFEKRELWGVYEAASDGAMNIVPNGFAHFGKRFPAQVRFTPIWYCSPIPEIEFRDAIKENYYCKRKFNLGLSEDQVHRLLILCSMRKLKDISPPRQIAREITRDGRVGRTLEVELDQSTDRERREADGFETTSLNEYTDGSFGADGLVEDERHLMEGGLDFKDNINPAQQDLSDCTDVLLHKKRRLDDHARYFSDDFPNNLSEYVHDHRRSTWHGYPDCSLDIPKLSSHDNKSRMGERYLTNNLSENVHDHPLSTWHGYMGCSLDIPKISSHDGKSRMDERERDVYDADNNRPFESLPKYYGGSVNVYGVLDDNRCLKGNQMGNEHVKGIRLGFSSAECFKELSAKGTYGIEKVFPVDDSVENEQHMHHLPRPPISTGHATNHLGKVISGVDNIRTLMGDTLGIKHIKDSGIRPVKFPEYRPNPMDKAGEDIREERNLMSKTEAGAGILDPSLIPGGFSLEDVRNRRGWTTADRSMHAADRIPNIDHAHWALGSASLTDYAGNPMHADARLNDDGRAERSIQQTESVYIMNDFRKPAISTDFQISNINQNPLWSRKPFSEPGSSILKEKRNFETLRSKFHDATVTRSVLFDPQPSNVSHGHSLSNQLDQSPNLVQGTPPLDVCGGNLSLDPYGLEVECSGHRPSNVTSDYESKLQSRTTSKIPDRVPYGTCRPPIDVNSTPGMELNPSDLAHGWGSLSSRPSTSSLPVSKGEIYGEAGLPFHDDDSCKRLSRPSPDFRPPVSEGIHEHSAWHGSPGKFVKTDSGSAVENFHYLNKYYLGSESIAQNGHLNSPVTDHNGFVKVTGPSPDSKGRRQSVFSRLSSVQDKAVQEQEKDGYTCVDYLDTLSEEVMDILRKSKNIIKPGKSKRSIRPLGAEPERKKRQVAAENNLQMNPTNLTSEGAVCADDENPVETRRVEFKRRSETKKGATGKGTEVNVLEGSTEQTEMKSSGGKQCKRRKLVRPSF